MEIWIQQLLHYLAMPEYGLSTVFLISFVSATLLPLGSEPAVFGLVKLNPELFWPAILIGALGNTLGGAFTWWMGYGAQLAVNKIRQSQANGGHGLALSWLVKLGPKACLLSWLPFVGDPLCAVAGWLRLPFFPCLAYMATGKFLRYLVMTSGLLWVFPHGWA
jgi:membrane protein YqaA with SNARE-associated domain